MKFCPNCRNMLYGINEEVVEGTKTAVLSCRKCEYKEPITSENPIVYEHLLKEDKIAKLSMNPYLKYDPTIDHITSIACPNKECSSNKTKQYDIVPVKISETHLIWMYQCAFCDTTWKQSSRAS